MIWLRKSFLSLALVSLLAITPFRVGEALTPPTLPQTKHWGAQKNRELVCLAKNIYFESRGEPFHGKVAVAQVTINRVNHEKNFKSTICGVVYESRQFSWTDTKHSVHDQEAWNEALKIAHAVMQGSLRLANFDALYFHTKQVKPVWRKTKKLVKVIGNHIFYA